jgi:hypothetical protein
LRFVEALPRASIWESNKQPAKSAIAEENIFGGNKENGGDVIVRNGACRSLVNAVTAPLC